MKVKHLILRLWGGTGIGLHQLELGSQKKSVPRDNVLKFIFTTLPSGSEDTVSGMV
jgi:hypothetical protein